MAEWCCSLLEENMKNANKAPCSSVARSAQTTRFNQGLEAAARLNYTAGQLSSQRNGIVLTQKGS